MSKNIYNFSNSSKKTFLLTTSGWEGKLNILLIKLFRYTTTIYISAVYALVWCENIVFSKSVESTTGNIIYILYRIQIDIYLKLRIQIQIAKQAINIIFSYSNIWLLIFQDFMNFHLRDKKLLIYEKRISKISHRATRCLEMPYQFWSL